MVAVSLGTETDGSIICPASFNVVVGIKPTVGLTSRAGVIPFSPRQDTVGYVAPEYANSGLLNKKSDVYSFGVVLLEAITGRDPVDYGCPADEVNLVGWLKMMVGNRRSEEVADPTMETKPARTTLKRALLTVLWCVDPDFEKRVSMGEVVGMLESEEYPLAREECWL